MPRATRASSEKPVMPSLSEAYTNQNRFSAQSVQYFKLQYAHELRRNPNTDMNGMARRILTTPGCPYTSTRILETFWRSRKKEREDVEREVLGTVRTQNKSISKTLTRFQSPGINAKAVSASYDVIVISDDEDDSDQPSPPRPPAAKASRANAYNSQTGPSALATPVSDTTVRIAAGFFYFIELGYNSSRVNNQEVAPERILRMTWETMEKQFPHAGLDANGWQRAYNAQFSKKFDEELIRMRDKGLTTFLCPNFSAKHS